MKHILFVDDEQAVLDGIRTMLHKRRNEWQVEFADSGAKALEMLEKRPADLVCSDMRMPAMDGAQLLTAVSERWPQTARIVLSGYSDMAQTIRLVPIAHQYLSKPCAADQLQNVIDRCLRVRELLERPALCALVGRIKQLPSMPRIYAQLREATTRPNTTAAEIARIIGGDVALTSKVLQVANSAFFRLARKVTKVEQAVMHLGFACVRNLVMSVEVFSQWPKAQKLGSLDPETFNANALKTAATARALAAGRPFADDAMIAAMLRDIGYLVFLKECPTDFAAALQMAREQKVPLFEAERHKLGATHAEVGAYLLALWGLPYSVVEAVAHHHDPLSVQHSEYDLLSAVALAEAFVQGGTDLFGLPAKTAFDASHLQTLHCPLTWDQATAIAGEVHAAGEAA